MFCLTNRQIQEALLCPVYSRRLLKGLIWFLGPNSAPSYARTKQVSCVLLVQLLKTFTYCIQHLYSNRLELSNGSEIKTISLTQFRRCIIIRNTKSTGQCVTY